MPRTKKTDAERAQLREATRLARAEQKSALAADWRAERQFMEELRGKPLTYETLPLTQFRSYNQHVYMRALQAADDIIQNAPRTRDRLKAIELILDLRTDELRIRASLRGAVELTPEGEFVQQPAPSDVEPAAEPAGEVVELSEELAREFVANQRALLARGG